VNSSSAAVCVHCCQIIIYFVMIIEWLRTIRFIEKCYLSHYGQSRGCRRVPRKSERERKEFFLKLNRHCVWDRCITEIETLKKIIIIWAGWSFFNDLFVSEMSVRQSSLQFTMPNFPLLLRNMTHSLHRLSSSAACFCPSSWSVTAVLLAKTVNTGWSGGWAPDRRLIILIGEFAGWLVTAFNPSSTSSCLGPLVVTLNGLQNWNKEKHFMNLVIMEPYTQNQKTTTRIIQFLKFIRNLYPTSHSG
jgi:hypothetical protein